MKERKGNGKKRKRKEKKKEIGFFLLFDSTRNYKEKNKKEIY